MEVEIKDKILRSTVGNKEFVTYLEKPFIDLILDCVR